MMNEIDMIQTEIGQRVTEAQTIADEAQAQAQAEAEAAHVQLIRELENLELDAVNDQELADSMAALSLADDTSYLTTDELNKANASRDFVLDAMANADSDLLLARAKQALLSEDKSLIFLYRRYLPAQWEKDNSRGLGVGQEYVRVMRQLEASIVPESVRQAEINSRELKLDAERRRVAAKQALWIANGQQGQFNPFS